MTKRNTCDGCQWFYWWGNDATPPEKMTVGIDAGECRRMPPTTTSGVSQAMRDGHPVTGQVSGWSRTGWPSVEPFHWCGEWKAKEDPK